MHYWEAFASPKAHVGTALGNRMLDRDRNSTYLQAHPCYKGVGNGQLQVFPVVARFPADPLFTTGIVSSQQSDHTSSEARNYPLNLSWEEFSPNSGEPRRCYWKIPSISMRTSNISTCRRFVHYNILRFEQQYIKLCSALIVFRPTEYSLTCLKKKH